MKPARITRSGRWRSISPGQGGIEFGAVGMQAMIHHGRGHAVGRGDGQAGGVRACC
jgi:hypothetical protein